MKSKFIAFFILLGLIQIGLYAQNKDLNTIIPRPQIFELKRGDFVFNKNTIIVYDANYKDLQSIALQLSDEIKLILGLDLKVTENNVRLRDNYVSVGLISNSDALGEEGYKLVSTSKQIGIQAVKASGVFYGMQTLVQLIRNNEVKRQIPAIEISDKPRFAWRGMMLDVGRYFYSIEFIKKMLDEMAVYKLNKFHWHLTDDQGWRIEIKKYPELTQKGAWRSESQFGIGLDKNWINTNPHGGYYTQEEIKEVIKYAQSKYIEVIPEIEVPGHSKAALSVFPHLSCTGGPFEVPGYWGVVEDVYCAGNEDTFKFVEDVLTEVVELFPSKIVHIGGDECKKNRWKTCAKCQNRIKKEGLKDEYELQSYFIKRVQNFLNSKGKSIIGWDEILEGGLAPNAKVMSWRGTKGGIAAAKQGHEVVMSPNTFLYLDYAQGAADLEPAYGRTRFLPIEKVYSYNPVSEEFTEPEGKLIKGVQANVWTELLHNRESVEYMIFPRITAVAEVAWTNQNLRQWDDFSRRIEYQFDYYKSKDITFAESIYYTYVKTSSINKNSSTALITLSTPSYNTEIRYTLDGTAPKNSSLLYDKPFTVKYPINLNTATFRNGKRIGKTNNKSIAIFK
ncbi:family 20 glycosylhydrolase [Pedobacter sp. ASV1-7]|uniref:beta-N-acetylhexosaminidase n=1 Tax=Pedobacter sp. ASV1-7 TaxID=3145237 RepID=UPI0032E908E9